MNRPFPPRLGRFVLAGACAAELSSFAFRVRAEEPVLPLKPPREVLAAPAAPPNTPLAFVSGASVLVLGLGVGGALIGSNAGRTQDIAGWMVMQSSFAVAPVVAHGVVQEWGRGLLFATPAVATTAGSAAVFGIDSKAVRHSPLSEQRVLWSLFVVGLFSSAVGVVDATFADRRARQIVVSPSVGRGQVGLEVGGSL